MRKNSCTIREFASWRTSRKYFDHWTHLHDGRCHDYPTICAARRMNIKQQTKLHRWIKSINLRVSSERKSIFSTTKNVSFRVFHSFLEHRWDKQSRQVSIKQHDRQIPPQIPWKQGAYLPHSHARMKRRSHMFLNIREWIFMIPWMCPLTQDTQTNPFHWQPLPKSLRKYKTFSQKSQSSFYLR